MEKRTAYLALGANVGERRQNLRAAVGMLAESDACEVDAVSSLYESEPVGIADQPRFLNAVIRVRTSLDPQQFLALILQVEKRLGRERTIRWGPRVIDIDILTYEDAVVNEEGLVLPHPRMRERAFVLVPLAEIAPDLDIGGGLTAAQAASKLDVGGMRLAEDGSWSA